MKIYSWNMLFRNAELDQAFSFIEKLDFDVLCLQEVPEQFLERLKTLSFHIAYGTELDLVGGRMRHTYDVILSRYPIISHEDFALPDYVQSLRVRVFMHVMMRLWGWRFTVNRRGLCAEIDMPQHGRVRVTCLHLTLSHPLQRMSEFEAAVSPRDTSVPRIVCGDLNTLESPHITVLNWLLGGRVSDIFAWRRERKNMEQKFAELKLQNPLRGRSTHPVAYSQLDHILVSDTFRVTHAEVLADRHGSDHHPVFVDCS